MKQKNAPKIFGAENDTGIPDGELAVRIRSKLLHRLEHIADNAPEGLVTEVQYKKDGKVYKLVDLVASYKNVVGKTQTEEESPEGGFDFLQEDD